MDLNWQKKELGNVRTNQLILCSLKKEKRMKKNKHSFRDLWDTIKHTNICIMEVPEREKKNKESECLKK